MEFMLVITLNITLLRDDRDAEKLTPLSKSFRPENTVHDIQIMMEELYETHLSLVSDVCVCIPEWDNCLHTVRNEDTLEHVSDTIMDLTEEERTPLKERKPLEMHCTVQQKTCFNCEAFARAHDLGPSFPKKNGTVMLGKHYYCSKCSALAEQNQKDCNLEFNDGA